MQFRRRRKNERESEMSPQHDSMLTAMLVEKERLLHNERERMDESEESKREEK